MIGFVPLGERLYSPSTVSPPKIVHPEALTTKTKRAINNPIANFKD
jgi:hypothetical protein